MAEVRECRKCGEVKALDDFYPVYGTTYHMHTCKRCRIDAVRPYVDRWQAAHWEQYLATQREALRARRRQKRAESQP